MNGEEYDGDKLKDAIKACAANANSDSIELLVKSGNRYLTVKFDYHGGLR